MNILFETWNQLLNITKWTLNNLHIDINDLSHFRCDSSYESHRNFTWAFSHKILMNFHRRRIVYMYMHKSADVFLLFLRLYPIRTYIFFSATVFVFLSATPSICSANSPYEFTFWLFSFVFSLAMCTSFISVPINRVFRTRYATYELELFLLISHSVRRCFIEHLYFNCRSLAFSSFDDYHYRRSGKALFTRVSVFHERIE